MGILSTLPKLGFSFKALIMGACCPTSLLEQNFHSYRFA
jgi:hypothetical protein